MGNQRFVHRPAPEVSACRPPPLSLPHSSDVASLVLRTVYGRESVPATPKRPHATPNSATTPHCRPWVATDEPPLRMTEPELWMAAASFEVLLKTFSRHCGAPGAMQKALQEAYSEVHAP